MKQVFWIFKGKKLGSSKRIVPAEELSQWFGEKVKKEFSPSEKKLDETFDLLIHEIKTLKKRKDVLDSAEPNLPEDADPKEKNAITGTKDVFIAKINSLEKALALPEKTDFHSATAYAEERRKTLDEFKKIVAKSLPELTHFETEVAKVIESTNQIEMLLERVEEICGNDNIRKITKVASDVRRFCEIFEKKNDYHEMLSDSEGKYENLKKERETILSKMGLLKKDAQYKEFETLEENLGEIEKKLAANKKLLKTDFANISKVAKDLTGLDEEHKAIIAKYGEDPEDALLNDLELDVIKSVKHIKTLIATSELDAKKKSKLSEKLSVIDELRLTKHTNEKENLELDRNDLKRRLRTITAKKEVDDLDYKLAHIDEKMGKLIRDMKKLNHELDKPDLENLRAKIEEGVKETLKENISIDIVAKETEDEESVVKTEGEKDARP